MLKNRLSIWTFLFLLLLSLGNSSGMRPVEPVLDGECELPCNVIQGFGGNTVQAEVVGATISGGGQKSFPNAVKGSFAAIGGGKGNTASAESVVGGGSFNNAGAFRTTVGGGNHNSALAVLATVGGGSQNTASGARATVGGGRGNAANDFDATVAGGSGNNATSQGSAVGGGSQNTSGHYAAIPGGLNNTASGGYAAVSGGVNNLASGFNATVGGGAGNVGTGKNIVISGGLGNIVAGDYGAVSGGRSNLAGDGDGIVGNKPYATVGGGSDNIASGTSSTIPGGTLNRAAGDYSLAAGYRAIIDEAHGGAFLYADASDLDFHSQAANEFAVRATGGVRFTTAIDSTGVTLTGVRLPAGSGSWSSLSSQKAKTNISPVDEREILALLARLPLYIWSYKDQDSSVLHIGPMAHDFYATFGFGEDAVYINTVDADGVALAAILGVTQILRENEAQLSALRRENAELEARVAALEQAMLEKSTVNTNLQEP